MYTIIHLTFKYCLDNIEATSVLLEHEMNEMEQAYNELRMTQKNSSEIGSKVEEEESNV